MIRVLLSKGRIANNILDILLEKEIINEKPIIGRNLKFSLPDLDLMIVRSKDISMLLDNNIGDIGILGSDVISEYYKDKYYELYDFNEKKCFFALAAPKGKNKIIKVASTYPNIAKDKLEGLGCEIIEMSGCLELYPNTNLCDGIYDIVETGESLRANGLEIIEKFDSISTRIITTKEKCNNKEIKKLIYKLR